MGLSNQSEQDFLNHSFRPGNAYSALSTHFVSIHDGDPGDTGANEIAGTTRFQVVTPSTGWEAAGASVARRIRNAIVMSWTGISPAVTISHVGVWSLASGGVFMAGDQLGSSKPVSDGGSAEFGVNQLTVTFQAGAITDYLAEKWLDLQFRNVSAGFPTPAGHNLRIYNGLPSGGGTQVSGSTPQSITFGAPAPVSTRHDVAQNNGDISFAGVNADTCDHWAVVDTEGTPNILAERQQQTLTLNNGDDVDFSDGTVVVGID